MKGRRSVIAGISILILFLLCSCDIFHLKVVWEEEKDLSGFVLSGDGGSVELTCPEVNAAVHYNWYLDDVLVHEGRTYAAEEFAEPAVRSYTCIATGSSDEVLFTKEYVLAYTGLPTVYVDTASGNKIASRNEYVDADIRIIKADGTEDLNSECTVKGRGNSSWFDHEKKGFNFKLPSKSKVLGMKKSKKWSVISNDSDSSMMGNWFASYIGRTIFNSGSEWEPKYEFVNLVVNGDYAGCYVIAESIKIEGSRVDIPDIAELTKDLENDNNGDGKVDLYDGGFIMEFSFNGRGNTTATMYGGHLNFKDPDLDETEGDWTRKAIAEHATQVVNRFEAALFGDSGADYRDYLDVPSFIDWYLVNEFMGNFEAGFLTSTYFYYNPADGKIHMGPNWDFDKTILFLGNEVVTGRERNYWFRELLRDPAFVAALKDRWNSKKAGLEDAFDILTDKFHDIDAAREMNDRRWNRQDGATESRVRQWLESKLEWMDSYIASL